MIAALKKERRNPFISPVLPFFPLCRNKGSYFGEEVVAPAELFFQILVFGMFLDVPGDERA
jgi:hypothetical protein